MTRVASISALLLAATLSFAQAVSNQSAPNKIPTPASGTHAKSSTTKPVSSKKSSRHKKPVPQKVVEAVPEPPPPPPTLAQQPPVPPQVTYQNGLLSIDAPNSTLGDILGGIRRATGATIEGPTGAGDRMVVHLGPGQPRQVVAALLGTSRFDYIVMGTPQQPNGVHRLVLIARQGGTQPSPSAATGGLPAQPQRPAVAANTNDDEDEATDRDEDAPPSQPMVAQPETQQQNPAQAPQLPPDQMAPQQGQQNQVQPDQQQTAPKTPEQLYKELQDLERQRQQPQNQNQNPPPPPPQ